MNILLLRGFNNYFNRTVKQYSTITDYKNNSASYVDFKNINFNPNDGVVTELIIGSMNQMENDKPLAWDVNGTPDYLICHETQLVDLTKVDVIKSRWFILESERTRDGQYRLALKRDVLVDNLQAIIDAPIYIEKATIKDVNNPLLFNSENLSVNQIKQAEYPIKDETQSGWVVGYVPRDAFSTATPVDSDVFLAAPADIEVEGISSWPFWKNVLGLNPNGEYLMENNGIHNVRFRNKSRYGRTVYSSGTTTYFAKRYVYFRTGVTLDRYNAYVDNVQTGSVRGAPAQGGLESWYEDWTNQEYMAYTAPTAASDVGYFTDEAVPTLVGNIYDNSAFKSYVSAFLNAQAGIEVGSTSALRALDTKIIKDTSTNIYYRIKIKSRTETSYISVNSSVPQGSNIINFINNNLTRTGLTTWSYTFTGNLSSGEIGIKPTATEYWIELEQLSISLRVNIDSERAHLEDAQYDMFCIPYSDSLKLDDGTDTFTCNKSVALTMATTIGAKTGTSNLYDIQLLPYCPCREAIMKSSNPSDTLDISGISHDVITAYDSSTGTYGDKYSAIIWCSRSIFDVERSIEDINALTNIAEPYTQLAAGIRPETYKYYILDKMPTWQGISITSGSSYNTIKVCRVDKTSGAIIDSDYYSRVQIDNVIENRSIKLFKGTQVNPEYQILTADYTAGSWRFAIYIDSNSYGSQYINNFDMYYAIPTVCYFNALLDNAEDIKISNECDLYRLVSGNYNGIFEFSLAKSGGIDGVKIECNYKPWSPYIHILPKLKGLYGENFTNLDDARGLICGGDFSLTQLSNEWANYQLNNKTYQEMFDRQIKNLDVNNRIAMQQAEWQAGAGALTGAASGAMTGALAAGKGGGYAALAGGIVGGIGGLAAGVGGGNLDIRNLKELQAETRSYTIDMYNYNLQNIQAVPTSITKTTALTYNTRIWPFIEYYTCTDVEKQALRDKIKYNGMTVMAIGKISDYIDFTTDEKQFIIGEVIRLPDLQEDSHMANEIYNELLKGVYI